MQAKKSSSGQMFGIFKKRVIQENMFEMDYVIKWNLFFEKRQHHFTVWEIFLNHLQFQKFQKNCLVLLMDLEIFKHHFC